MVMPSGKLKLVICEHCKYDMNFRVFNSVNTELHDKICGNYLHIFSPSVVTWPWVVATIKYLLDSGDKGCPLLSKSYSGLEILLQWNQHRYDSWTTRELC